MTGVSRIMVSSDISVITEIIDETGGDARGALAADARGVGAAGGRLRRGFWEGLGPRGSAGTPGRASPRGPMRRGVGRVRCVVRRLRPGGPLRGGGVRRAPSLSRGAPLVER